MKTTCQHCGCDFMATNAGGITPKYCSNSCRQKAYRARKKKRESLPKSMTERAQWVRADGKRPITVDGAPASSTRRSTWSSFKEALRSKAGDGFGVMLGGGLGCYDLDNCFGRRGLAAWARKLLDSIVEPVLFVERSVSGRGLHVFVEAGEAPGYRRGGVEKYTRARFIRVTGNKFDAGALVSA